jgi:hypothetical protein
MPPGRYFHCGIEVALVKISFALKALGIQTPTMLKLIFNIDVSSTLKSSFANFGPSFVELLVSFS